jgi:hypothetical protein
MKMFVMVALITHIINSIKVIGGGVQPIKTPIDTSNALKKSHLKMFSLKLQAGNKKS